MTANLPALHGKLPPPTPQVARSLSQPELEEHRTLIAFDVRLTLHAYYDPDESAEVKAGLLAWFCDELEDWKHKQVVWALRAWNRDNPRRRPTPGDITALLKRARGEKMAAEIRRQQAELVQPQPMTPERHAEVSAELADKLGAFIRRIEPPKERASQADMRAATEGLTDEAAQ